MSNLLHAKMAHTNAHITVATIAGVLMHAAHAQILNIQPPVQIVPPGNFHRITQSTGVCPSPLHDHMGGWGKNVFVVLCQNNQCRHHIGDVMTLSFRTSGCDIYSERSSSHRVCVSIRPQVIGCDTMSHMHAFNPHRDIGRSLSPETSPLPAVK